MCCAGIGRVTKVSREVQQDILKRYARDGNE